jgi:DNA-binding GntR family transcriptional regulator
MRSNTSRPSDGLGPVPRKALFDEVASRLRHRIHTQDLAPGQRLDELELCQEFSVSRTPLREALKVLQSEGLVKLIPRRGCFVTEITGTDLANIFSVLMILEESSTVDAVARMNDSDLRRLKRLHQQLENAVTSKNLNAYMEANSNFHEELHAIANNPWRDGIIRDLRRIQMQFRYRSLSLHGRLENSLEEHRQLLQALEQRDSKLASSLMRQHIENQWLAMHRMSEIPIHSAGNAKQ